MPWPPDETVQRVVAATRFTAATVRAVLEAAGVPRLMGAKETAEMLGTTTSNLARWPQIKPEGRVAATSLYLAEDVEALARERGRSASGG